MRRSRATMGFGSKEAFLALIVVVIFAAILVPILLKSRNQQEMLGEAGRMRNIYIGLSMYEEQFDTKPAPNLVAASVFDPVAADYLSFTDPFAKVKADRFPSDPGLSNNEFAPFRISFSYLQNFVRSGKIKIKPWSEARTDPLIGVLANEWYGNVQPGQPFEAQVGGRLMRITTDGSVYVVKDRGGPKALGNSDDLFLRR